MNRREFVKTCAALGVSVAIPSVVYANHKPAEGGLVESNFMVGSTQGRIYFVPGDADTIAEALELTHYHIDVRQLDEALTLGPLKVKDDWPGIECSIDTVIMWSAVTLEDSEGRTWATADGERWECGDMWFEVAEGLGV